jgi:hypothetical protein
MLRTYWPKSANIIAEYNRISRKKLASGLSVVFAPVSVDTDMISEGISSGFRIKEFSTRHAPAMPGRNVKRSRASGRLSCR